MSNLFEKSINMGLGVFAYSREKIEVMVDELVNKGEIAKKDAQGFVSDIVKKVEDQKDELKKIIREEVRDALNLSEFAKKDEIREIIREEIISVINSEKLAKKEDIDAIKK